MNTTKEFIKFLKTKNLSENTVSSYSRHCKEFKNHVKKSLSKIEPKDVYNFIQKQRNNGLSGNSIAIKLSSIKEFFKFLSENEICEDVTANFTTNYSDKKLPSVISEEDINSVLDTQPTEPMEYRNKAILEFMYATGVRVSELINLKMNDLNLENNIIFCRGKGSKHRMLIFHDECKRSLLNYFLVYRNFFENSDFVFLNSKGNPFSRKGINDIVKKYFPNHSPHSIRHSFATHLYNREAGIKTIQELLGHESITTTQIYTHLSTHKIKSDYDKFFKREEGNLGEEQVFNRNRF